MLIMTEHRTNPTGFCGHSKKYLKRGNYFLSIPKRSNQEKNTKKNRGSPRFSPIEFYASFRYQILQSRIYDMIWFKNDFVLKYGEMTHKIQHIVFHS